ncbi:MAG: hypothetical protein ACJA09_003021 [Alcanivorax sp.]|jgi:hypothetical protein
MIRGLVGLAVRLNSMASNGLLMATVIERDGGI